MYRKLKDHETIQVGDEWNGCCSANPTEWIVEDDKVLLTKYEHLVGNLVNDYRRAIRTDGCPDGFRWADDGEVLIEKSRYFTGTRHRPHTCVGNVVRDDQKRWLMPIEDELMVEEGTCPYVNVCHEGLETAPKIPDAYVIHQEKLYREKVEEDQRPQIQIEQEPPPMYDDFYGEEFELTDAELRAWRAKQC